MAYITTSDLKEYLGITTTNDDTVLSDAIDDAQAIIENITKKVFQISAVSSHYFTVGEDTDGLNLYLDSYLASLTDLVITNGDATTVTTAQYTVKNKNKPPYFMIKLLSDASIVWTYSSSPEDAIEVEGYWGWSITPPDDIVRATKRLAAFLYKQRDSQVFDSTAFTELGIIRIKHAIPNDILSILEPYIPVI